MLITTHGHIPFSDVKTNIGVVDIQKKWEMCYPGCVSYLLVFLERVA